MEQVQSRSKQQTVLLILTLGFLYTLTPFSIDMYLPAFPEVARDLNVLPSRVALSLSTYFIGYALGQLLYGPLLDRFGRKSPVYFGVTVYVLATIGCMTARSLEWLLIFRFLSAIGGCAASVSVTAMVRDFFPPESATKVYSSLMLVLSVSPLLAPTLGTWVLTVGSWRTIFTILAGVGVLNLVLLYAVLPQALPPDHSVKLDWRSIVASYGAIVKERQFLTYTLAGGFSFAGLFIYLAASPSLFMEHFQVSSKVYSAIFAGLAVGVIGGTQLNHYFANRFSTKAVFRTALILQIVVTLIFTVGTWLNLWNLPTTLVSLFLILLCAGISSPNATTLSLEPFTKGVGSASALLGFVQLGIGSATSSAVGLVKTSSSLPMAATMCASSAIALVVLRAGAAKAATR
jgi:DHA1 family bicyclomycin/chloramphenicol resistance-like MFS transporter